MVEAAQLFAKHANADGLQTITEFQAFAKEHAEIREARGEPDTVQTPEKTEKWFNAMNKVNPSTNGIGMADMMVVLGVSFAYQKKKLAQLH